MSRLASVTMVPSGTREATEVQRGAFAQQQGDGIFRNCRKRSIGHKGCIQPFDAVRLALGQHRRVHPIQQHRRTAPVLLGHMQGFHLKGYVAGQQVQCRQRRFVVRAATRPAPCSPWPGWAPDFLPGATGSAVEAAPLLPGPKAAQACTGTAAPPAVSLASLNHPPLM